MSNASIKTRVIIWSSLFVALVLQIIPWPGVWELFNPLWLYLVTCYWALALPHRVSVGSALFLGFLWDILLGSTIGIRAMGMSIVIAIIVLNHLMIRNMALWQQVILITMLSILLEIIIFFGEFINHNVVFDPLVVFRALISGVLWMWLFFFMRRIRRSWQVK